MSGLASRVSGSVTWSLLGSVSYSVPAWTATMTRSGGSRALGPSATPRSPVSIHWTVFEREGAGRNRTDESVDTLRWDATAVDAAKTAEAAQVHRCPRSAASAVSAARG